MKPLGRKTQYTADDLGNHPCAKCGSPATSQFGTLALPDRYIPICARCDIELNRLVVNFIEHPDSAKVMASYEKRAQKAVEAQESPQIPLFE